MMKAIGLLVLVMGLCPASFGKSTSKSNEEIRQEALAKLSQGCARQSGLADKTEAERNKICNCVSRAVNTLELDDVLLLSRVYQGDAQAKAELRSEKHETLAEFDESVAVNCVENSSWQVK